MSIELTGLRGNHPLGALAAFGLLRVLTERTSLKQPRLSWNHSGNIAVLHTTDDCDREALLQTLVAAHRNRDQAVYLEPEEIKMPPDQFQDFRNPLIDADSLSPRQEVTRFLAAFASELVTDGQGKNVKPTAFHMTAGQQKFLKSCRELATSLNADRPPEKKETSAKIAEEIAEAFSRALFGPWEYRDAFHSLGFDPMTEALYALSDKAPTKVKPTSERAAVWLGIEAMPLFPCLPQIGPGGKVILHTRGFEPGKTTPSWLRWPLWSPQISLPTLRSLLGLAELFASDLSERQFARLSTRGIFAVFQAACLRDGNGRGTFRHAKPVVVSATPPTS